MYLFEDVGSVSSFSYFRQLELSKDFEDDFSINAGRAIAKQFHQQMFDQTGFPGNKIRKTSAKSVAGRTEIERLKLRNNNFEQKEVLPTYKQGYRT